MISSLLYGLNHASCWQRKVRVWDRTLRAASLDRLLFLALHRLGWMGRDEACFLRKLVQPGMQIVDAGANIGLYSLLLARLAGDNGRVYSFEPEPNLFGIFSENCAANKALNILPFQCAAGRLNERALFRRSSFNSGNNSLGGNGAGLVEVEVVRVDDVLPVAAVDFIKLDVQGHELAALAGMERVLASSPAVRVLFEFWPAGLRAAHTPPETLLNFFFERGFDIYELDEPGPRKLSEPALLIEKLGHKRYVNLFASRTGIPKS